jgi:hypothetical protein
MTIRTLLRCNPNGHGTLALKHDVEAECYFVITPDDEDGAEFDGDLEAARDYYEEQRTQWSELPNRYDLINWE